MPVVDCHGIRRTSDLLLDPTRRESWPHMMLAQHPSTHFSAERCQEPHLGGGTPGLIDHVTVATTFNERCMGGGGSSSGSVTPPLKRPGGPIGAEQPAKKTLRRGKWTPEEEEFVQKVIDCFHAGLLPLEPGTTLRAHLADRLSCDPMRITKKFSGLSIIGKCIFHPASNVGPEQRAEAMQELKRLEAIWQRRMMEDHLKEQAFQRAVPWPPDAGGARPLPRLSKKQIVEWLRRAREVVGQGGGAQVDAIDTLIDEGEEFLGRGLLPRPVERQGSGAMSLASSSTTDGGDHEKEQQSSVMDHYKTDGAQDDAKSARLLALLNTARELVPESPRPTNNTNHDNRSAQGDKVPTAENDGAEGLLLLLSFPSGEADETASTSTVGVCRGAG